MSRRQLTFEQAMATAKPEAARAEPPAKRPCMPAARRPADAWDEEGVPLMSQNPRPAAALVEATGGSLNPPPTTRARSLNDDPLEIMDSVHGTYQLPGVFRLVVNSPAYQRLRHLKQLGGGTYYYPSATHTRFEHSLGVTHLSLRMAKTLQRNDTENEFGITDAEVLCVGLAALVHDLGHGPFSHAFEAYMDESARIGKVPPGAPRFCHETLSMKLLRRLILETTPGLKDALLAEGIGDEELELVATMVSGLKPEETLPEATGRSDDKRFLCEIVANSRNGLDTDKLDYLLRDTHYTDEGNQGLKAYELIDRCRVVRGPGGPPGTKLHSIVQSQIAWEWAVMRQVRKVFDLRADMHRDVYQSRIKRVSEQMIRDILLKADSHVLTRGGNGGGVRVSEAAFSDLHAYSLLDDGILGRINCTPSAHPDMKDAQDLHSRLHRREFYECVLTYVPKAHRGTYSAAVRKLTMESVRDRILELGKGAFDADALWVDVVRITFGGKKDPNTGLYDDPLRYILYYNPRTGVITFTDPSEDAPMTCPRSYEEVKVRIYCKQDRDAGVLASLRSAASSWRSEVLASSPCSAFATTPPPPRLSVRAQATPH